MHVDLAGKVAVVTGGGTGIGRAIALGLGRCGASVVVNYAHSRQEAEAVAEEVRQTGSRAAAVCADVTCASEVQAIFAATVESFGRLDILVNNAGGIFGRYPTAADLQEAVWDQTLALNAKSVFLCAQAAMKLLPDGSGRIINISSISARSGGGDLAYAAAKAAVNNMTRNLARELAPRGITVNAVAPGVIDTRIHQRYTPPEFYRELIERIPLKRDGRPEDVVGAVLLLASREGSYVTGEIIEVNGGLLMS